MARPGNHSIRMAVTARIISAGLGPVMACLLTLAASFTAAQAEEKSPEKLLIGSFNAPPFTSRTATGTWEGLSIALWESIAPELGVDYEFREYPNVEQLIDEVEQGQLDVILTLASREENEEAIDLTQPYYRSGLAIAVPAQNSGQNWLDYIKRLDLANFVAVVGLLILLWLIAGASMWLLESRRNRDMFGGGLIKGLGHGVWWAAVTMTTVGYGDKAPLTPGGRVVAVIWMFASIILISAFTASISASLTAEKLVGKVRGLNDLPHVRVGTVADSVVVDSLADRGVAASTFTTSQDGLQAIVNGSIDAFVFDETVLKTISTNDFPGLVSVLPFTFEHYYLSMGVQNDSPLREQINRVLLRFIATPQWSRMLERHIPAGS